MELIREILDIKVHSFLSHEDIALKTHLLEYI